jgi:hypothetical protein
MGSGRWTTNVYDEHNRAKAAAGIDTFDYSVNTMRKDRSKWKAHPSLDPKGLKKRESRDNTEHPESNAVIVLFDVTGSMGGIPRTLQKKLPQLLGILLRKNYLTDPQILFGAVGDATCDAVPLQIGQFESDNRMDQNLENLVLEGGGGGQRTESYELGLYFAARHTDIDCWNKRRKKGYLFLIGDEMAYSRVNSHEVAEILDDGLEQHIPIEKIVREASEMYHVFYILPRGASYGGDKQILGFWRGLLGEQVLELEDAGAVSELIAATIGLIEGSVDLGKAMADLKEEGASDKAIVGVKNTLATIQPALPRAEVHGLLPGLR